MFSCFKNHFKIKLLMLFFILIGCQLQEPNKNHGIVFLENRAKKLIINESNKNDVIKIMGQPHSKSVDDQDIWIYLERTLTPGAYHKFGKNILKENNVLVLEFDKYGVLKKKKFYDKKNNKNIQFTESETENILTKKSFVEKFLSSMKEKIYRDR